MNFINVYEDLQNWDWLPVFTMKNYIDGGKFSKPFVQLQVCYTKKIGLCFKISAYENIDYYKTLPNFSENEIKLVWSFSPTNDKEMHEVKISMKKVETIEKIKYDIIFGSNQQGNFWGAQICILDTAARIQKGNIFAFNVFKYWHTFQKYKHFGRMFGSADLQEKMPFSEEAFCILR